MAAVATVTSSNPPIDAGRVEKLLGELKYLQYEHGLEKEYLPSIRALISKDLSEPYSIYVYRYFLYQWGHLCFMVGFTSLLQQTWAMLPPYMHAPCQFL